MNLFVLDAGQAEDLGLCAAGSARGRRIPREGVCAGAAEALLAASGHTSAAMA